MPQFHSISGKLHGSFKTGHRIYRKIVRSSNQQIGRLESKSRGAPMITKRHFSLSLCATGLALMAPGAWQAARSQAGARGARIIVGFGPGGALDVVARLLAAAMKDYASPFIV